MTGKILFLAGSSRKDSFNKKLAQTAYQIALEKGATATFIDLKDYPMPIYNGDLEAENGLPEEALALKKVFLEHDALFIASPEYNSSYSPLLKNAIDWISRPHEKDEPAHAAFLNKVAAITATSPGGIGGLRGLVPLRMLLGNISILVLPEQLAVANAFEAFDSNGNLSNTRQKETLSAIVAKLISVTTKLL